MLNLMNYLTKEDNKKISAYLKTYGAEGYIGNDKYLQDWADSKKKLFHLLGGNLIYKVPFSYERPQSEIYGKIDKFMWKDEFSKIRNDVLNTLEKHESIPNFLKSEIMSVFSNYCMRTGVLNKTVKFQLPGKNKILQLQEGGKISRAIQKLVLYCCPDDKKEVEDLLTKYSMIFNDKIVRGTMCLSIHPLDFLTMSDNANKWSSCMSWKDDGCYHLGTLEMMNSNNVIVAYLESKEDMSFEDNNKNVYTWNSKKWRQLFYCTKEIIVSGKAYPYQNITVTKKVLKILQDLAKENWNHAYQFGIEQYCDMIHVDSLEKMETNHNWVRWGHKKHNIIFDSDIMYNDMFNDNNTSYWCVRNKVKKNTMIKYSGKCRCLCCNDDLKVENDYIDGYNERFNNTKIPLCNHCQIDYTCDYCSAIAPRRFYFNDMYLCPNCYQNNVRKCPCCGETFYLNDYNCYVYTRIIPKDKINNTQFIWKRCYMCKNCRNEKVEKGDIVKVNDSSDIFFESNKLTFKKVFKADDESYKPYLWENLELVEPR